MKDFFRNKLLVLYTLCLGYLLNGIRIKRTAAPYVMEKLLLTNFSKA